VSIKSAFIAGWKPLVAASSPGSASARKCDNQGIQPRDVRHLHCTHSFRLEHLQSLKPQVEIRCYLALDGCKFWLRKTHVFSGEPRGIFSFKLNTTKNGQSLAKFDEIYRYLY
jgi:hypothetical protein